MRIGIAQTQPVQGDVVRNIGNHFRILETAVEGGADVVLFPELSITGYEPALAKQLALERNDPIFTPFQQLADAKEIVIGVGVPLNEGPGITISLLLFQPFQERFVYSKRQLHPDEFPYFSSGTEQPLLRIMGNKIGLGICYETLQRTHFAEVVACEATLFLASVAKSARGIEKAYKHFPAMAKEFGMPVLMANGVGCQDDFLAAGRSSVWDAGGTLVGQLDETGEGLIFFDAVQGVARVTPLN